MPIESLSRVPAASPATLKTAAPATAQQRNFLADIVIDFGPPEKLGRLFLKADTEMRQLGIALSFAPVSLLMDLNRQHRDSWAPLVPVFDSEIGGFNDENGYLIVGRNGAGEVVLTQAARLYTLTDTTLQQEVESMRLFYSDPERSRGPDEWCRISCPTAATLQGRITFSGAVWYRPDYRKLGVISILGAAAKAYAFTKWYTDITMTFMAENVFNGGTWKRAGFEHVEWEVTMNKLPIGTLRAAMIWMNTEEMLAYFDRYLAKPHAQVDRVVDQRTA